MTVPRIFATQPAGNVPASYLDEDFAFITTSQRVKLTTDMTINVPADFAVLQDAIDAAYGYDLNGFTLTIQLATGTYAQGIFDGAMVGQTDPNSTTTNFILQGDTTSSTTWSDCVVSQDGFNAITIRNSAAVYVRGLKVTTTTSGSGISVYAGGRLYWEKLDLGACAASHIDSSNGGFMQFTDNSAYKITGNNGASDFHIHINDSGIGRVVGATVTKSAGYTDTGGGFIGVAGRLEFSGATFTGFGAVTGPRFLIHRWGSVIIAASAQFDYFPGDVNGETAVGGLYDDFLGIKPGETLEPLPVVNDSAVAGTSAQVSAYTTNGFWFSNVTEGGAGSSTALMQWGGGCTNVSFTSPGGAFNFNPQGGFVWQMYATGGGTGGGLLPGANETFDIGSASVRVLNTHSKNLIAYTAGALINSGVTLTDAAGGLTATLTNSPAVGNPTKWIQINDNGTIRKIPTWL